MWLLTQQLKRFRMCLSAAGRSHLNEVIMHNLKGKTAHTYVNDCCGMKRPIVKEQRCLPHTVASQTGIKLKHC